MNKLIIGAVSVLLMLSMTGMAEPFSMDINLGIPNQNTNTGATLKSAPGASTYFSIDMWSMHTNTDLFNITDFTVTGGPFPRPTLTLIYTPAGPILPGGPFGVLNPNGVGGITSETGYIAANAFSIAIPAGMPNGTAWTFAIAGSSLNRIDTASFSRDIVVYVPPANISGMKFNDLNNNGVKDGGEPGLAGWTIRLKNQSTGAVITTTVTDGSGNYIFLSQPAGNYTVEEVLQAGWTQTFPSSGTYNRTLSGTDVTGLNFGNFLPPQPRANISGMKFNDLNNNGAKDGVEPGLAGWTINLKNQTTGTIVDTTTTDSNGNYSFMNEPIGNYIVAEVNVGGWTQTFPSSGTYSITLIAFVDVTGKDFGNFRLPPPPADQSLRIYGEDDYGPGTQYGLTNPVCTQSPNIYELYNDSFNPGVIPKDSVTFNPAIIQWDPVNYPMSANSQNIDVKKFLRIWYEPWHKYNGCLENPTYHPTLEVESTYMLIDAKHTMPITGAAGQTDFAFPIAETQGQIGLGTFNASGNINGKPDLVDLALVSGSGTQGAIQIQKSFTLSLNQQVQFLDHKLKLVSLEVDPQNNTRRVAKVEITYAGNLVDDTARQVVISKDVINFFDRHNIPWQVAKHPDRTWYTQLVAYNEDKVGANTTATIIVGKEIRAGDTFYVNSVRYDVPAVYVEYVSPNWEFKYITLRTPLPKGNDVPREESVVSSQWITEIKQGAGNIIPLDPPFNMIHDMVDDINIDLWSTSGLQVSPFPGDKNTNVSDRIVPSVDPINAYYKSEDIEPRYHSFLEEILSETIPETWTWKHVQTKPDQYTELVLPSLPDIEPQYLGDYLVTLSFYANNSNGQIDHIYDATTGMPRAVFVYDGQSDAVHSKDLYVNDREGAATVRIYGEDDIGPGETVNPIQALAPKIYTSYDDPFDPAEIPKDSITFNPAIIQWDATNWTMSADSQNIDVKKFLRMWYEPNHTYNGILNNPELYGPTIEVESTYMLIDSKHKLPTTGSAGSTVFAFPTAEKKLDQQIGIASFDGNFDGTPDLVDLASVSGSDTAGTVRLQHTYDMGRGETVQFLDHKLNLVDLFTDPSDGKTYAKVNIIYAGNLADEASPSDVELGAIASNPTAVTFFDRHNAPFVGVNHPYGTWYAKLEFYKYDKSRAQITVGKEISAGDTFYVNSVRYDVPAVYVPEEGKFKYITLRTPLPKGSGDVFERSVVTSQLITRVQPNSTLPVNPPFNGQHYIVDDIDTPHTEKPAPLLPNVVDRIIGTYPALDVQYVSETIEPRYRTNLLEILREQNAVEDWYYYNITTLPINYTEFKLPPDFARRSQNLHNDYLITLSWLAPNSEEPYWIHGIEDDSKSDPYNERAAFVFDAIDSTGLYVNELTLTPPAPPNQVPVATFTANTPVQALVNVVADPAGTYDPNGDPITLTWSWGDGTTPTTIASVTPVTHQYNRAGTYTITLSVSDGINTAPATRTVVVTNDGVKISFKPGWNHISTPITTGQPAGVVLAGVPGYVQTWKWNRATPQGYAPLLGGEPLQAGQGYFVYASGAADVIIRGTGSVLSYSQLNIQAGWNNVGPGLDNIPTPGWAYHWNPTALSYETTTTLVPGNGYWILG